MRLSIKTLSYCAVAGLDCKSSFKGSVGASCSVNDFWTHSDAHWNHFRYHPEHWLKLTAYEIPISFLG